jgi:exosome complex RNA-binding protein Rrp4
MAELSKVQAMSFEIDPVKYGQLWEKVDNLTAKVDKLEEGMEELLALANKGRGGFWVGMMVVSGISSVVGFIAHWLTGK